MKLSALIEILEKIAPTKFAEPWDNVGLLVGDGARDISRAMLCIDYTSAVAEEARVAGCNLIVAYHPPIFKPINRLAAPNLIFDAIARNVAIYSPHTALDIADGGTNDMLADAIGMIDRAPLRSTPGKSEQYKLVVFVPESALENLSRAIFEAGAGRIGRYSSCSFQTKGTGTFFGEEGTSPAVGQSGRLEKAEEIRLETVVPIDRMEAVIGALRKNHPYEEPAFDLNLLAAVRDGIGMGRIGNLTEISRPALFDRIRRQLDLQHLLIAGPTEGSIHRAAVCAGSCGDLFKDALVAKADVYLTGEIRHHDAVRCAEAGLTVICTLHSNSERAVLKRLKKRIEESASGVQVIISTADRDPFSVH